MNFVTQCVALCASVLRSRLFLWQLSWVTKSLSLFLFSFASLSGLQRACTWHALCTWRFLFLHVVMVVLDCHCMWWFVVVDSWCLLFLCFCCRAVDVLFHWSLAYLFRVSGLIAPSFSFIVFRVWLHQVFQASCFGFDCTKFFKPSFQLHQVFHSSCFGFDCTLEWVMCALDLDVRCDCFGCEMWDVARVQLGPVDRKSWSGFFLFKELRPVLFTHDMCVVLLLLLLLLLLLFLISFFYFPTKAILLFSKLRALVLAFSHFHIFLFILDSFTSSELVEDKNVASLVAAAAVVVVDWVQSSSSSSIDCEQLLWLRELISSSSSIDCEQLLWLSIRFWLFEIWCQFVYIGRGRIFVKLLILFWENPKLLWWGLQVLFLNVFADDGGNTSEIDT